MNELPSSLSWLVSLFSDDRFVLPFFSTVGAAVTLLLLQFVSRLVADKKRKIYAAAYILDACCRIQKSAFILLKHTILPHIEATQRILKGETDLLEDMFMADEFDILKAGPIAYSHLSEEQKVLLGYDDIDLVQMFETINYLASSDTNRLNLNDFVKNNLKSRHEFTNFSADRQNDILNTYWDYLESIKHEENRLIAFISMIMVPKMKSYAREFRFLLFSTKAVKAILVKIEKDQTEYAELIPANDFFERSKIGGIQSALKERT